MVLAVRRDAGLTNEFRRGYTRLGCVSRSYRWLEISLLGRCSLKPRPISLPSPSISISPFADTFLARVQPSPSAAPVLSYVSRTKKRVQDVQLETPTPLVVFHRCMGWIRVTAARNGLVGLFSWIPSRYRYRDRSCVVAAGETILKLKWTRNSNVIRTLDVSDDVFDDLKLASKGLTRLKVDRNEEKWVSRVSVVTRNVHK